MRILNEHNNEIFEHDLTVGYLALEQIPDENGGVEIIQRYIKYTDDELSGTAAEPTENTVESRLAELEEALELLLSGVTE